MARPKPSSCVAILTGRTFATPLAIAAARIAGHPFAILDLDMPKGRLEGLMRRIRPGATIALARDDVRATVCARFGEREAGPSLEVRRPHPLLEDVAVTGHLHARGLPTGASHACATSGSSGEPKVVLCGEEGLLQTADAQIALIGDVAGEALWTLNPSFDASLSDILTAILARRPLRAHRQPMTRAKALRAALAAAASADLPPSLMASIDPAATGLQTIVFGGERAHPDIVRTWSRHCRALQAYGPTEASVCVAMAAACEDWRDGEIGRPLVPGSLALLTEAGPVAIEAAHPGATPADGAAFNAVRAPGSDGVTGELMAAGAQVALGYLDDAERTAARFPEIGGIRYHATGDVARIEGGRLLWLGRNDRQVKLNGRLVCPEEVEAAATAALDGAAAHCALIDGRLTLAIESGDARAAADAVERRLGAGFRPQRTIVTGPFPRNANEKVDARRVEDAMRRDRE